MHSSIACHPLIIAQPSPWAMAAPTPANSLKFYCSVWCQLFDQFWSAVLVLSPPILLCTYSSSLAGQREHFESLWFSSSTVLQQWCLLSTLFSSLILTMTPYQLLWRKLNPFLLKWRQFVLSWEVYFIRGETG